ncbi:hypothetical protein [uncultured Anaerococcus sp.]|uniref:hypothetical protein n=1 Tax=uncultured Anaerococcus sp. TaxID=293428 RepID=UPI002889991F|nr:hypothetical protein [uncultured Anaerococcus sp.]
MKYIIKYEQAIFFTVISIIFILIYYDLQKLGLALAIITIAIGLIIHFKYKIKNKTNFLQILLLISSSVFLGEYLAYKDFSYLLISYLFMISLLMYDYQKFRKK